MKPWRVGLTPTAQSQIQLADEWWQQHRQAAPRLLRAEIARAFDRLSRRPWSGVAYLAMQGGLRRVLLRRIGYHVYYRCQSAARLVEVLAIWHAARTGPPDL